MHGRWRRWRGLRSIDRRETLRAAILIPLCEICVRVVGLRRTRRWLSGAPRQPRAADPDTIARAVHAVERVRCHSPVSGTCLSRSLALEHLLHRQGVAADLRIGVRRTGRSIAGHAWLEVGGRAVNDTLDVHREFTALEAITASPHRTSGRQEN